MVAMRSNKMCRQHTVITLLAALVLCSHGLALDRSAQGRQPLLQSLRNRFWQSDDAARAPTARTNPLGERLADEIFSEARGRNRSPEQIGDPQRTRMNDVWTAFMQMDATQDRSEGAGNGYHSLEDAARNAPSTAPINTLPPVEDDNPALQPFLALDADADTRNCCDLTQCLFCKKEKNLDKDSEAQRDAAAAEAAVAGNAVPEKKFRRIMFVTFSMFAGTAFMQVLHIDWVSDFCFSQK